MEMISSTMSRLSPDPAIDEAIPTPYVKIAVAPGQTLWSIAQSIEGSGDKRDLVDEIISINHLASPDLSAGQRIYIPTRH